jgi:4'-phosphopantetheinyl transferase
MNLRPVLIPLPTERTGREGIELARTAARRALTESARIGGMPPVAEPAFQYDADGAPRPLDGWYHAVTNTQGIVAALVAPVPVAIDAEWLGRPRVGAARTSFAPDELGVLGGDEDADVLRLWTAKEAMLKLDGAGLARLSECRIVDRIAEDALLMQLGKEKRRVSLLQHDDHVLAVACAEEPFTVAPTVLPETGE